MAAAVGDHCCRSGDGVLGALAARWREQSTHTALAHEGSAAHRGQSCERRNGRSAGIQSRSGDQLHNICITTQRHSRTLNGTQETPPVQLKALTSMFLAPLQGGGRRFDPYSAHSKALV
jgi:hypothetical protein